MAPLPERMRAVLLTSNGGPECLEIRDDVVVPHAHEGEVLIRVAAAGVNNTDINTRIGWYAESVSDTDKDGWTGETSHFPRIQGADACGHIVAVGNGIDPARIGERVLVEPVFRGPHAGVADAIYFGSERDGAFAQYAIAPSIHAHVITSNLSDAELASFPCAYSAAENMLTRTGLSAGETVFITGASGGVGSAAVQLAKRRGANVIAVVGAEKAEAISAAGADRTIARDADFLAKLGGESVDVVIDTVGGPQFDQILNILKRGGRYGVAGAIAGPHVKLDLRTLYLKDLCMIGCTVLDRSVFPKLVSYIEREEIKPLLAAIYPMSEIVAAQQAFLEKRHVGKIVLIP